MILGLGSMRVVKRTILSQILERKKKRKPCLGKKKI